MVNKIEHGENISKLGNFRFIRGATSQDSRDLAKKALISKRLKVLITTCIWREGINIPSLDVVVNAGGGKSEIATLQQIGRGLRKTDEKSTVTIVDFFDPSHNYLISHFGERITLYMENDWL
jgi:superfamily II DNA or RNA helicase